VTCRCNVITTSCPVAPYKLNITGAKSSEKQHSYISVNQSTNQKTTDMKMNHKQSRNIKFAQKPTQINFQEIRRRRFFSHRKSTKTFFSFSASKKRSLISQCQRSVRMLSIGGINEQLSAPVPCLRCLCVKDNSFTT